MSERKSGYLGLCWRRNYLTPCSQRRSLTQFVNACYHHKLLVLLIGLEYSHKGGKMAIIF